MAYQDRYGMTKIRSGDLNSLSISWDCENDPSDISQRHPVLLFTPDMKNTVNHWHIELSDNEAALLREWLGHFLEEKANAST